MDEFSACKSGVWAVTSTVWPTSPICNGYVDTDGGLYFHEHLIAGEVFETGLLDIGL